MQYSDLQEIINRVGGPVAEVFLTRAGQGALTRDENPTTHFCVYFAAYCSSTGQVFLGHHKKAGLWLFNGGHIDRGELPVQAAEREIREEWGLNISARELGYPQFLSIAEIDNRTRQTCTRHYDLWYFVPFETTSVIFDPAKLAHEFHETRWMTTRQALEVVTDPSTRLALEYVETHLMNNDVHQIPAQYAE